MHSSNHPHPPLPLVATTTRKISPLPLSLSPAINMSYSSSPIFVPSHSASLELVYPSAGNTPFPPASPTPFANNVPIPPMNTCTSTPDSIPTYVREYEDATNDLMVEHMIRMMGLTSEEATAFVTMHQLVLKPFLRGVSPPP